LKGARISGEKTNLLKIETIVTAIVFFGVGFLAGYVVKTQRTAEPAAAVATAGGESTGAAAPDATQQGLPAGHPPLEEAQTIEAMQNAAEQNPTDKTLPLKLANYLYDKKLYPMAIEWYQKALALDPKDADARTDMGTAMFYNGQPQDAISQYRQALETDPGHEQTMFNMIVVDVEGTHNLPEAQRYYKLLDRKNPNYPGLSQIKTELDAAARNQSASRTNP
jgi:tetratricopeptide (TPR) repeat protein